MKAKAKKKVVKKAARKPKDPCGARLKNKEEHNHDWWQWQDEVSELQEPATKLRQAWSDFDECYGAELMSYLGERDHSDERDMYHRLTTALCNLRTVTENVEMLSNRMRQRYVADKMGYTTPKTNKWVEVSTGRDKTTLLSQYKGI